MEKLPNHNQVSETTKKLIRNGKKALRKTHGKTKYTRQAVYMNLGYNFLENQYVVRKFFQKKYKIDLRVLEILLYLYPKQYFSHADYKAYPLTFTHRQIVSMIKKGHVIVLQEGKNKTKDVYTLSHSSKLLIQNYYKYLAGEIMIPVISENNPMIRKDATPHERKIINMFKRLAKESKEKEK